MRVALLGNAVLFRRAAAVSAATLASGAFRSLVGGMLQVMVHESLQLFLMDESGGGGSGGAPTVVINPRVVRAHGERVAMPEGCVSIPGIVCVIQRPRVIDVAYTGEDGRAVRRTLDGIAARVFQHELDHLQGVVMLERARVRGEMFASAELEGRESY